MKQKTKVIAEDGKQNLVITREFNLPVELLFKAYVEPEIVEQWMGTKVVKMENKKHGSYQFETTHNGHVVFSANGTIHDLVPGQKIIRTFEMENAPIGVQLEFIEFRKLSENSSQLTMNIIYQSEQHRAEQLKLPFAYGVSMAHDKLQQLLSD